MNSHNPRTEKLVTSETIHVETDHKDVRILLSEIAPTNELAIVDDHDTGGDPYNSTGQHVIIKPRNRLDECP